MKAGAVTLVLVLAGCAHVSGVRYTFTPCNPGFQDTVRACFYEAGIGGPGCWVRLLRGFGDH